LYITHRRHKEHVWALLPGLHVEPFVAIFRQHTRGERPETLAELDLQVHGRLHLWRTRVAEDAARPEGSRTELHPAVQPADHLPIRQKFGDVLDQLRLVGELLAP